MDKKCMARIPKPSRRYRICGYCGEDFCYLKCYRCRLVYYCSKRCQKRRWRFHKWLCRSHVDILAAFCDYRRKKGDGYDGDDHDGANGHMAFA